MSHQAVCLQVHSLWHGSPAGIKFAGTFALTWLINQHVCRYSHYVSQTSMSADTFSLTRFTNQPVSRHGLTQLTKPACLQTHSVWHGPQTSMFADTFTDMAHKPACFQTHSLWCSPPAGIMFVSTFTLTWFTNLCYIYRHIPSHAVHQLVLFTCTFFWTWFMNSWLQAHTLRRSSPTGTATGVPVLGLSGHACLWVVPAAAAVHRGTGGWERGPTFSASLHLPDTRVGQWSGEHLPSSCSCHLLVTKRAHSLRGELSCPLQFQPRAVELGLPDLLLTFVSG